ncbi:MAG: ATP-dependent protease LonB [Syntrophomonadaceae bacterium]
MNNFFLEHAGTLYLIQVLITIVIGIYFWSLLQNQRSRKSTMDRESGKERLKLQQLRSIKLSEPLSSQTRPASLDDIVGQKEGVDILRSALCGSNPQHVIIYGPPGIGKTAAARLVLEEAKKNPISPFGPGAQFVEVDATISRFDERNIADPLIGSVHDPIYQGAGALGAAGIPQPKPGACTKAHGGILFIDEIGELHPTQLNKLLKVLEDRKVMLESAYYSETDDNIPSHVHDIFMNGLPADFRMIGATTRIPEELPPALRSRCLEVFFKPLDEEDILLIAENAVNKINFKIEKDALKEISRYANNGREAVRLVELAAGMAMLEKSNIITLPLVERVLANGRLSPRMEFRTRKKPAIGVVNGLAVYSGNIGCVIEVEANSIAAAPGRGIWTVTGVVEEEHLGGGDRKFTRKSMAKGAVEAVLTVLKIGYSQPINNYDIHLNFPGGVPIDGPSAGVAMATAVYSTLTGRLVDNLVAMTGEVSIHGKIKPVGGVINKIEAAKKAGLRRVIIPQDNWLSMFDDYKDIEVIPAENLGEVFDAALVPQYVNLGLSENNKISIFKPQAANSCTD